jgi:hypothetical protein
MANLSDQDKETLNDFNGMSVGEIFKKTRLDLGYELSQIVEHLNIGTDHLEAIENNDEKNLPPKVYAVGFVRAYADTLGLDAEKMVYLFKVQIYGKKHITDQKKFVESEGKNIGFWDVVYSKKQAVFVVFTAIVFLTLIIGAIAFIVMSIMAASQDNDISGIPPVPQEMLESSVTGPSFVQTEDISDDQAIEPMDLIIRPGEGGQAYGVEPLSAAMTLKIVQDISAEIRLVSDGSVIVSDILNAGDVVYIGEDQDILISATNGAGIEVYLDGQNLGLLGQEGQEVRMRALSVNALRLINAE